MSSRILVTGASGRAGTEMVRQLAAAGASVRAAVHYPDRDAESRVGRRRLRGGRLRPARHTGRPPSADVDKAVLITPEEAQMVAMTANLVQAAERAACSTWCASPSSTPAPASAAGFLAWHREAEELVTASPVPSTILRPNSYMQNFLTMYAPSIYVRGAFFTPMGAGRISYIDARDVADAAVRRAAGRRSRGRRVRARRARSRSSSRARSRHILTPRGGAAHPLRRRGRRRGLRRAAPARRLGGAHRGPVRAVAGHAPRRVRGAASPATRELLGRPPRRFADVRARARGARCASRRTARPDRLRPRTARRAALGLRTRRLRAASRRRAR